MDNKTINPSYTCEGCMYEDEDCIYSRCTRCARNNLSGYYKDMYVKSGIIKNDLDKLSVQ